MKVVGLKNEELVPSYSTSFRTTVRWKNHFLHKVMSAITYTVLPREGRDREKEELVAPTSKTQL